MENDNTITYNIKVNDLIEALKEYEWVKIEFYKDGNFTIMSETATGRPDEAIHTEKCSIYDLEYCDNNVKWFTDMLEKTWVDGFDTYKHNGFQATIYVNWVRE